MTAKMVLVTGASRGIGRAIAKRLARDNYHVLAHYGSSDKEAQSLQQEVEASGGKISLVQADLAVEGAGGQLAEKVKLMLGDQSLFGLVNNAGMADWTPWLEIGEADFDRQFAVNVKAPFTLTRALLTTLAEGGRVVFVSSVVSKHAFPDLIPYAATKGAVDVMARNFAQYLGARGITVNTIAPGATRTDMSAWLNSEEGAENAKSMQALKRVGEAEDIADATAFLISSDARWVTGQILDTSGGWKL